MNRADIFKSLNEDYPSVRTEVSSNPIGLFETNEKLNIKTQPIENSIVDVNILNEKEINNGKSEQGNED